MATSTPRRMPPSTRTVARPATASTTSGRASAVASAAVELAAAVVGDDDAGGAVLDRQLGVLGGEQALDQDRHAALGGEVGEVGPVSGGFISAKVSSIVTARSTAGGGGRRSATPSSAGSVKPVAAVALAVAAGRRVDGDDDRLEAGRDRLVHQRPGDASSLKP